MNNSIPDRIEEVMSYYRLNKNSLAIKSGLDSGNLGKMLSGKQTITNKTLEKICDALPELNISWLKTGEGNMMSDYIPKTYPTDLKSQESGQKDDYVPLLPVEAMAGSLQGFSEGVALRDCRKIKSPVQGADWAIQISGDSMEPDYKNGSYLYIKKMQSSFIPWGQTMVVDTIDGVVVKNIYPIEGTDEFIEARSINQKYPPFKIETSDIIGVYRVLGGSFINSTI